MSSKDNRLNANAGIADEPFSDEEISAMLVLATVFDDTQAGIPRKDSLAARKVAISNDSLPEQ